MNLNFKRCLILCALAVFCLQVGCTTNKYREPITKFQVASAVVSANARKSFIESNRINRNFQIKKLARQGKFITLGQLNKVQFFDPKDLQARLEALDCLNEYVDLLVSIANSDAPQNISKSATDLTGALSSLTNTVAGLQGIPKNSNFKTKTINAFGLASVIVSEVLKDFAQHKIKEGLEAAITNGAQPVNDLIGAIGDDLNLMNLDYVTKFESQRDDYYELYNCELNKAVKDPKITECKVDPTPFSQQTLNGHRDLINNFEDALETLHAANPLDALTKMKKAHIKIVMLAKSDSPASFTDAVTAIEDFAAAAKRLGDAVEKLKNS